jgi:hypothetical protein
MDREVMFPAGPFADCAEPMLPAKLAAFGFTHFLVRTDSPVSAWFAARESLDGARLVRKQAEATVFEIVAHKPAIYVMELPGFSPRVFAGGDSWRWMGVEGSMTVINVTSAPVVSTLDVELDAFHERRRVRVIVDDELVAAMTIDPAPAWHTIGPLTLASGPHTIRLVSDSTASPAAIEKASVDRRALSLRLRGWRWHSTGGELSRR